MGTADLFQFGASAPEGRTMANDFTPIFKTPIVSRQEPHIADFGEKIGGARKDTARKLGPKKNKETQGEQESGPAWRRQYKVWEQIEKPKCISLLSIMNKVPLKKTGRWVIAKVQGDHVVHESERSFATKEEAEESLPLYAVASNHRVYEEKKSEGEPASYGIFRTLSNGNRPLIKGGFSSRDEAMKHMSLHAVEIIEHKLVFPEQPWLERIERQGTDYRNGKDVTPLMFQETFKFRAGEFGLWNMGGDGQAALNHAYDALLDLAEMLGVPPADISLNGTLAIAFGARGHGGKMSAKAHYEPDKVVINLTKIRGAGSLAHEWFHALDNHFSRLDGKAYGYASEWTARDCHKVGPEIVEAFRRIMTSIREKKITRQVSQDLSERAVQRSLEEIKATIDKTRTMLCLDLSWRKRAKKVNAEQLAEFDRIAAEITAGQAGEKVFVEGKNRLGGFYSFEAIRRLNEIFKAVQGRSFDTSNQDCYGRSLYWQIGYLKNAAAQAENARAGKTEVLTGKSEYFKDAAKIDSFRSSVYWSKSCEMAARAFAAYVFDKLAAGGKRSDYLAYAAENTNYSFCNMKPYPEGDERIAINAAFQSFIDLKPISQKSGESTV